MSPASECVVRVIESCCYFFSFFCSKLQWESLKERVTTKQIVFGHCNLQTLSKIEQRCIAMTDCYRRVKKKTHKWSNKNKRNCESVVTLMPIVFNLMRYRERISVPPHAEKFHLKIRNIIRCSLNDIYMRPKI